ncbi:MAG: hypothetical protein R3F49_06010 [Planctomycetota bacterium]
MDTLRSLGLTLVAMGTASGCTAVHWSGPGGMDRHAGLVWIEQKQLAGGQRTRVSSLGLILDLRAGSRSYTLGARRTTTITPTCVEVDGWRSFEAATAMALAGTLPPRATSSSGPWVLCGETTRAPLARRETSTVGVDLAVEDDGPRAAVGYASRTRFCLPTGGPPLSWVSSADSEAHYLIHFKASPEAP